MFIQVHWSCRPEIPSQSFITCLSADNEVFPFQRTENNFRQCRHRKVATTQTLPRIQTSLSLKKFSMVKNKTKKPEGIRNTNSSPFFFFRLLLQAVSYFSFSAAGLSVLDCKLLTFGKTLGLRSRISMSWSLQSSQTTPNLQDPDRLRSVEPLPSSHLPAQPTIDPSNRLPSLHLLPPSFSQQPPWTKKERTCRLWDENLTGGVGFQGVVTVRRLGCWWYVSETPVVSFNSLTQHFT